MKAEDKKCDLGFSLSKEVERSIEVLPLTCYEN